MYKSVVDTPLLKEIIHESDRSYVSSLFTERHYPKGSVVFFHGDECNEMYVIKSGTLKIYRQDAEREIVLGHQFAGEVIGELEVFHYDNHRIASVATLEKSALWMIKKADLEGLVKKYPEILRKAFFIVSERLNQANRKLEYMAFLDTRVRVANLLLDLYSNFGTSTEDGIINWKITQQHFANMIGVGRESASRALLDLQHEGIIQLENKMVRILDLKALQAIAGGPEDNVTSSRRWHSTHKYIL